MTMILSTIGIWMRVVDYSRTFILRNFSKATNLLDLPNEILCEIMKELDCKDLLSIRMACHKTHSVTKTRQLWKALAQEIQASPSASPTEAPLDSYSDLELEEWVIRRCRVRYLWNNPQQIKLHTKILHHHHPVQFSSARLLPGGRWVLGITKKSSLYVTKKSEVYAVDLEGPDPTPRLLVDAGNIDEQTGLHDCLDEWSFWEDPDSSCISLRMVLSSSRKYLAANSRFCFYEIKSQGHGSRATLIARPINTLRCRMEHTISVTLTNEYMVLVQLPRPHGIDEDETRILSIFKYTPGNEQQEPFTVNIMSPGIRSAHILFGDRIVFIGSCTIDLYSLDQLLHDDLDVYHPLHRLLFQHCQLSRPTLVSWNQGQSSEIRMTSISSSSIQGISFPKDTNSPIEIRNLGDLPHNIPITGDFFNRRPHTISVSGYSHSMIIVEEPQNKLGIFNHSWDPESGGFSRNVFPLQYNFDGFGRPPEQIGICEEIGRAVIFGYRLLGDHPHTSKRLMVIDLL